MLSRSAVRAESKGRRKKLREVGCVTAVCTTCFCARAVMVACSVFEERTEALDVMNHPVRNVVYYSVRPEIVPSTHSCAGAKLCAAAVGRTTGRAARDERSKARVFFFFFFEQKTFFFSNSTVAIESLR